MEKTVSNMKTDYCYITDRNREALALPSDSVGNPTGKGCDDGAELRTHGNSKISIAF